LFTKKSIIFIFIVFIISFPLKADEKEQIITRLNSLKSLEFTFNQIINDKKEVG